MFVLCHYPPGRVTDPDNGMALDSANEVPRMRIVWAVSRTSATLLVLPFSYAALRRPSARQLWVLWAVSDACWLFVEDWYPNID